MSFHVPEIYRITSGFTGSSYLDGNNGQFIVRSLKLKKAILCQASDACEWEHVSAHVIERCPTWDEMCFIKDLFWDSEDCVIQIHPPKSEYVNNHPFCLHLWRPWDGNFLIAMPPRELV